MEDLASKIMRRKTALQNIRIPHEQVWRDCFDFSFPERGSGFYGQVDDAAALQAKRARLFDSTSTEAGQILAAAIMSGGTPSNSRWFGLTSGQDSEEEKQWFDVCAQIIFDNIHGSNYDAVGFEACTDMIPAGWFVLFIDVNREEGGYHFELWPLATCWIAASKPGGLPDTLVRCFELTVEQAIYEYGEENVSDNVRRLRDQGKLDSKVKFTMSIYPRAEGDYKTGATRARNMPWASCHIEDETKQLVRESGFNECPFVAPRWSKLPESDYAIGPMFRALPDVRQLNRLVQMEDTNIDLAVSGMWIAEDDGVLNPRTVKVGPRKIIVANSTDSMKPLSTGANLQISFTKKENLQAAIRRTMLADQLAPQDGPVRTATEIHVRVQQIRQLLGPIYGRMQAEWYAPMINRCFALAARANVLPPPPQSLAEKSYSVKFESPNAKAQKTEEVTAIESTLLSVGQIAAATADPGVWDNIDIEQSVKLIRDGRGAPASIGRTAEEIAAIRAQRQQAQQEQQRQQQQAQMAQAVAPQMVKNMSEA